MEARDLFEILVREHAQMLSVFISASVRDGATVDDIWQESMLVAWNRLPDFDRNRPFGPWLRGIAAKVILSRKRADARWILLDSESQLDRLESKFIGLQRLQGDTFDEKLDALRECLKHLEKGQQECLELRYRHDLKPTELSKRLGLALENVKKRLFRAKRQLLSCLERKTGEAIS